MIQEFNADGKTECGHLADITKYKKNIYIKKKQKQTNASAHLVRFKSRIRDPCFLCLFDMICIGTIERCLI